MPLKDFISHPFSKVPIPASDSVTLNSFKQLRGCTKQTAESLSLGLCVFGIFIPFTARKGPEANMLLHKYTLRMYPWKQPKQYKYEEKMQNSTKKQNQFI